jgi:glycosyltransferase involved in cell wall biosynthesis
MGGVRVERFRYMWPSALETICYQGGALINLREKKSNYFKLPVLVISEGLAIAKRLIRGKYDLLNSHWILPQGFTGTLAARPLGVPHAITVHGSDIFDLRSRLITPFKRFALNKADAVTVNSSATEKAVIELVPNLEKLYRIPMGVSVKSSPPSPSPIELREKYRRGQGPLLVFVGRVVKEKGVEDLIRAMALLVPHFCVDCGGGTGSACTGGSRKVSGADKMCNILWLDFT